MIGRAPSSLRVDQDDILSKAPLSCLITDCKSLFDAVNRSQSMGLGVNRTRTAIEALSIKHIIDLTSVQAKWVNSDRQLADILTKIGVLQENLDRALKSNTWMIVFGSTFTSAKDLHRQRSEGHFRKLQQS